MGRQMVLGRKGGPSLETQDEQGPGEDDSGNASPQSDAPDGAVECPNCKCQFDPDSGDVVKPGAPVAPDAKGAPHDGGVDLDVSEPPVPGKYGTAADAARGTDAMSALMGSFRGNA